MLHLHFCGQISCVFPSRAEYFYSENLVENYTELFMCHYITNEDDDEQNFPFLSSGSQKKVIKRMGRILVIKIGYMESYYHFN